MKMQRKVAMATSVLLVTIVAGFIITTHQMGQSVSISAWSERHWNDVQVVNGEHGVRDIAVSNPPAGLFLEKADLKPEGKYRLIVHGASATQTKPTLRLRVGNQEPAYMRAPDDRLEYIVTETDRLEMLVYGEEPFRYRLGKVELVECPECLSKADLRTLVETEVPALKNTSNPLKRAELISDWVSKTVDLGQSGMIALNLEAMSAEQMMSDIWEPDAGGAFCAGFAVFNAKVLALFGFNAFTVNFGILEDNLTHVTTIVAIEDTTTGWKYYVFDPTFNATFKAPSGEFVDFLKVLKAGRNSDARFESKPIHRTLLFTEKSLNRIKSSRWARYFDNCERKSSEIYGCDQVDYNKYFWDAENSWPTLLQKHGLPPEPGSFVNLARQRVFGVGGAKNPAAPEQFKKELLGLGIPFGRSDNNK